MDIANHSSSRLWPCVGLVLFLASCTLGCVAVAWNAYATTPVSTTPVANRLWRSANRLDGASSVEKSTTPATTPSATTNQLETTVFTKSAATDFVVPSRALLGGLLRKVQLARARTIKMILLGLLALASVSCFVSVKNGSRASTFLALFLLFVLSAFLSLRISQGWDEFYINLRHSEMLANHNVFSINRHSMTEGTVDSLPLACVGAIGKLNVLRLDDVMICLSLLGNFLVIAVFFDVVRYATNSRAFAFFAAFSAAVFPSVLYVGATGFTATIFSGLILLGFDLVYVRDFRPRWVGLLPFAMLTLVRTEGIFLTVLVFAHLFVLRKWREYMSPGARWSHVAEALGTGCCLAGPFVVLSGIRLIVYGSLLPMPIVFKSSTLGDLSYLKNGLLQFAEIARWFGLEHLCLIVVAGVLCLPAVTGGTRGTKHGLLATVSLLGLFCIPYYAAGGDWFPLSWARYLMPFLLGVLLTALIFLQQMLQNWTGRRWPLGVAAVILLFAGLQRFSGPTSTVYRTTRHDLSQAYSRWDRVDHLARFGDFLNRYLSPDAVVCNTEVATLNFFSRREMLDLFGVANGDIARSPLQPLSPGDNLHRKRNPGTIYKHRPTIVAFFESYFITNPASLSNRDQILADLQKDNFSADRAMIAYYRGGAFAELEKAGYVHVAVVFPGSGHNFFVLRDELEKMKERLSADSFDNLGVRRVSYELDGRVVDKFSSR